MADTLLGIETFRFQRSALIFFCFTLADTLLGIETDTEIIIALNQFCFTLADTLLGIETIVYSYLFDAIVVSLWLIPF